MRGVGSFFLFFPLFFFEKLFIQFFNNCQRSLLFTIFFHCVLFICQEKSCTIPTRVSKTNGSFPSTTPCVWIFTWVSQPCSWWRDWLHLHILFFSVCKFWPLKSAPSDPTGCGLAGGISLSLSWTEFCWTLWNKSGVFFFQGVWSWLNIWVNYEWGKTVPREVNPVWLGWSESYWHLADHHVSGESNKQ